MVQNQRELTQFKFWKLTTVLKHLDSSSNRSGLGSIWEFLIVMSLITVVYK